MLLSFRMASHTQASRYELLDELWEPSASAQTGIPKRARTPVRIQAYLPARLSDLELDLDTQTVQAVFDAQEAVADAQRHAATAGVNTIAQQLLRSEAIASSQIEGIDVPSHRALAKTLAGNQHRENAQAALANIEAVRWIYRWAAENRKPFSRDVLRDIHKRLAAADRFLAKHAGEIRTGQNWIGQDPYTPANADFIPPPARHVEALLDDLTEYMSRSDVPPLVQAAVTHVQFETVHPFVDGNGRVGRSLIGALLARREVCNDVIPPVSLALSRERDAYVDALTAWRFEQGGPRQWITLLARAVEAAALASARLASEVAALLEQWREQAGNPRVDSVAAAVIEMLPAQPILSAETVMEHTGRSDVAARNALNHLEGAGVLQQVTVGKRNRMWESVGLFALIDEMERELSGGNRGPAGTQ
jgi:Fic family protein